MPLRMCALRVAFVRFQLHHGRLLFLNRVHVFNVYHRASLSRRDSFKSIPSLAHHRLPSHCRERTMSNQSLTGTFVNAHCQVNSKSGVKLTSLRLISLA